MVECMGIMANERAGAGSSVQPVFYALRAWVITDGSWGGACGY